MMLPIRTGLICGCATLALIGGPALAQRSLFDQPVAQDPAPTTSAQATPATRPAAPATPVVRAQQATPATEPAAAPVKPKRRKPRGPVPARAITINNASPNVLTSLVVSGDDKSAKLSKPLAPTKKATLKLPAFKTCTVSVAAAFEGQAQAGSSELDICKDKSVRFTE